MIRRLAAAMFTEATRVAGKAAGMMLHDPRGQEVVARAVGVAQRGKQLLDDVQEKTLHAVGLAARQDHKDLRKQIARIKRKAREVGEKLDEAPGAGGEEQPPGVEKRGAGDAPRREPARSPSR